MLDLPPTFAMDLIDLGGLVQSGPLLPEDPALDDIAFDDAPVNGVTVV